MKYGTTICSKHNKIYDLAQNILDTLSEDTTLEDIANKISEIKDFAEQIQSEVSDAKEDGQSMESGLSKKRERIEELEEELTSLQDELTEANDSISRLEMRIEELETLTGTPFRGISFTPLRGNSNEN